MIHAVIQHQPITCASTITRVSDIGKTAYFKTKFGNIQGSIDNIIALHCVTIHEEGSLGMTVKRAYDGTVYFKDVEDGSIAHRAGIRDGDIPLYAHGEAIGFSTFLGMAKGERPLSFHSVSSSRR